MSSALRVQGISKYFGDFRAVDDVSFTVPRGSLYGLLGPNGAGKTTTLRMINDILAPDRGEILLFDELRPGPAAARRVGYLPEERGLYPKMRLTDLLAFFGQLRGLARSNALERADHWLDRLGLGDWKKHRLQDLSKGMQQKVQFATALLHEPDLLILDEPWSGLDPINAEVLRDVVLEQKKLGRTVVFSTHRMEQAEQICDHVCIIARGKKALEGSLSDIKRAAATAGMFAIRFADDAQCRRAAELSPGIVKEGAVLEVNLGDKADPGAMLRSFLEANLGVERFERIEPSLHQIFVDRVGRDASADTRGRAGASA